MIRFPAKSKRRGRQEIDSGSASPAPVRGWNTRDPLANMRPDYAVYLDNWFPTASDVRVRNGARDHVTGITGEVKTLAPWTGQSGSKLFAITNSGIFDVTTAGVVGASVQARTDGYCQHINFTTTGQSYLVLVNGVDDLVYTNGTTWSSVANFTINGGGTLLTKDISNINAFKRSIYFIEKNSMNFYYLPVDQITGTVSKFPLGGLFTKGGYLVAMGTWTIDGGQGMEDYSVFVTSEGQMAVYNGTDPSSATTWSLKGVYDFAPPLGARCFYKHGGDLLVNTRFGLFSMNTAMASTKMDLRSAISDNIAEAFSQAASVTGDVKGWQTIYFSEGDFLLTNVPLSEFDASQQYVMNAQTKAWCRFTGWNAYSWTVFNKKLYMGMEGKVAEAWVPGNDFNNSITAVAKTAFNYYSPRMRLKEWKLLQPILTIQGATAVNVAMDTDYSDDITYGPAIVTGGALSRWDQAIYDQSKWSSDPVPKLDWVTAAARASYCAAIRLRVIARDATVYWSATNVLYEAGALVG